MPYQAQTKQLDIKEAITITTLPRQTSRKKTRNQKQDISIKVRVTYQKNQTCLDIRKATHYTTFHLIQKKGTTDETIKCDSKKEKYFTRYNVKQRENRYTPAQRNLKKY